MTDKSERIEPLCSKCGRQPVANGCTYSMCMDCYEGEREAGTREAQAKLGGHTPAEWRVAWTAVALEMEELHTADMLVMGVSYYGEKFGTYDDKVDGPGVSARCHRRRILIAVQSYLIDAFERIHGEPFGLRCSWCGEEAFSCSGHGEEREARALAAEKAFRHARSN